MTGLGTPLAGVHAVTQRFGPTSFQLEPPRFGQFSAGEPYRAHIAAFPGGVAYRHWHTGVDLGCPIGTPVLAVERGKIVAAGTYASTGEHFVMLQIRPGTVAFYTHLSRIELPVGAIVTRGERIALSGNSGRSTGPHLHWEVRIGPPTADPHLSYSWFAYNPQRCLVGGDLAGLVQLQPVP